MQLEKISIRFRIHSRFLSFEMKSFIINWGKKSLSQKYCKPIFKSLLASQPCINLETVDIKQGIWERHQLKHALFKRGEKEEAN